MKTIIGINGAAGRMGQRLIIPECTDDDCSWMIGRTLYHQMGSRQSPKYLGLSLSKPLLGYGLALKLLRLLVQGAQFGRQFVKLPIERGRLRFLLWNR